MIQEATIQGRKPAAGDVWWIKKTTGAQDMHYVVKTFEKVALTIKLMDKKPFNNGVKIGAMWADVKMLNYVFYARFDSYEGDTSRETLEAVQQAACMAICGGVDIPKEEADIQDLKNMIVSLRAEHAAKEENSSALIAELRDQVEQLKKERSASKMYRPEDMESLKVKCIQAEKEASIYSKMYNRLLCEMFGITTDQDEDGGAETLPD